MIRAFVAVSLASTGFAYAHDFESLEISGFKAQGNYLVIEIQNTVKGQKIVCAAYDDSKKLVASGTWITDNLATQVILQYGGDDVAAVDCVFN